MKKITKKLGGLSKSLYIYYVIKNERYEKQNEI